MDMSRIVGFDFGCLPGQNHAKPLDPGTRDLRIHPYTSQGQENFRRLKCVYNRVGNVYIYIYVKFIYIHIHGTPPERHLLS